MPEAHRRSIGRRTERQAQTILLLALLGVGSLGSGCQAGDIRGTYDVEILVEGARSPIHGRLVLTSTTLDLESDTAELVVQAPPKGEVPTTGYADEIATPNSCLVLASLDPDDERPGAVTLFDARPRGNRIPEPFAILDGHDFSIFVEDLRFFANAIAGDIVLHGANGDRAGRIVGDRIAAGEASRCYDEIARYEERMREEAARSGTG